jgi:hypothetical protein
VDFLSHRSPPLGAPIPPPVYTGEAPAATATHRCGQPCGSVAAAASAPNRPRQTRQSQAEAKVSGPSRRSGSAEPGRTPRLRNSCATFLTRSDRPDPPAYRGPATATGLSSSSPGPARVLRASDSAATLLAFALTRSTTDPPARTISSVPFHRQGTAQQERATISYREAPSRSTPCCSVLSHPALQYKYQLEGVNPGCTQLHTDTETNHRERNTARDKRERTGLKGAGCQGISRTTSVCLALVQLALEARDRRSVVVAGCRLLLELASLPLRPWSWRRCTLRSPAPTGPPTASP